MGTRRMSPCGTSYEDSLNPHRSLCNPRGLVRGHTARCPRSDTISFRRCPTAGPPAGKGPKKQHRPLCTPHQGAPWTRFSVHQTKKGAGPTTAPLGSYASANVPLLAGRRMLQRHPGPILLTAGHTLLNKEHPLNAVINVRVDRIPPLELLPGSPLRHRVVREAGTRSRTPQKRFRMAAGKTARSGRQPPRYGPAVPA